MSSKQVIEALDDLIHVARALLMPADPRIEKATAALAALRSMPAEPVDKQQEIDTITELNHAQWLALEKASLLVAACNRLSGEAEEFDFDDGLGRGAPQAYWDEFEDALEQAAEAIDVANKTIHQDHIATPHTEAVRMSEAWQPIETAPEVKGDAFFCHLAWGPEEDKSTGNGFRWQGRWFAAPVFYALGKSPRFEHRQIEVTPTHWMKLPDAPVEQATAARLGVKMGGA